MQFPPDAATLLDAIAELLTNDVMPAAATELQHDVRVAAHLARLVGRETELGAEIAGRERLALLAETGAPDGTSLVELCGLLSARIGRCDDPSELARVWDLLVAIARDDLAIAKPGYDAWQGE